MLFGLNGDGSHTSHDEAGDQSADRTSLKENDGNSGTGDQSNEKQIESGDQAKVKGMFLCGNCCINYHHLLYNNYQHLS